MTMNGTMKQNTFIAHIHSQVHADFEGVLSVIILCSSHHGCSLDIWIYSNLQFCKCDHFSMTRFFIHPTIQARWPVCRSPFCLVMPNAAHPQFVVAQQELRASCLCCLHGIVHMGAGGLSRGWQARAHSYLTAFDLVGHHLCRRWRNHWTGGQILLYGPKLSFALYNFSKLFQNLFRFSPLSFLHRFYLHISAIELLPMGQLWLNSDLKIHILNQKSFSDLHDQGINILTKIINSQAA